jgi:peroxiredoxin
MVATLRGNGMLSAVLAEGQAFPDFMLPSAEGRLVSLAERLAQGPVVLCFFRGEWCPFCKLTAEALAEAMPRIEAEGASVLALTPETGDLPRKLHARHNGRFTVLADVDFGVGLAAGVVFKVPPLYRERISRLDLPLRHGNAAWCLPVPAVFVIAPDGRVTWRFANADFSRRAEPDDILAALRRLRS